MGGDLRAELENIFDAIDRRDGPAVRASLEVIMVACGQLAAVRLINRRYNPEENPPLVEQLYGTYYGS